MATYRIVSWQDIPSVVEAREGDEQASVPLSERFQLLIDAVAMRLGLAGTEEYLEHWQRGEEVTRPGNARAVAEAVAAELEGRFTDFLDHGRGKE